MKSASTLVYKYALKVCVEHHLSADASRALPRARTRRNDSVVLVRRRQETFFRAKATLSRAPPSTRPVSPRRRPRPPRRGERCADTPREISAPGARVRRARSEGSRERHRELTNEVSTYLARPKHEGLGRPCSCGARAGHLCRRVRGSCEDFAKAVRHNPATCVAESVCQWDDGRCWSAVGASPCTGSAAQRGTGRSCVDVCPANANTYEVQCGWFNKKNDDKFCTSPLYRNKLCCDYTSDDCCVPHGGRIDGLSHVSSSSP